MKYFTQYDRSSQIVSPPGNREKTLYSSRFNERGVLELYESGKQDTYDYIQSHASSVDINVIIARYRNGDDSALNRVQGTYFDSVGTPSSYADFLNTMIGAREYFEGLPLEARAQHGHSFERFIASLDKPREVLDPKVEHGDEVKPVESVGNTGTSGE